MLAGLHREKRHLHSEGEWPPLQIPGCTFAMNAARTTQAPVELKPCRHFRRPELADLMLRKRPLGLAASSVAHRLRAETRVRLRPTPSRSSAAKQQRHERS
jgi:hypothetical protein